jgi:ring-1,2-phenylacetyl-CoA epoxidase subunit PaaB
MVDRVRAHLGLSICYLLSAICYYPASSPRLSAIGDWRFPMNEWPLWEIFVRSQNGLSHKHVGSLHAADARMAIDNARDVYARRNEGISIWVVRSADLYASDPADKDTFFDPAKNKIYRHPTFYTVPPEVKHL